MSKVGEVLARHVESDASMVRRALEEIMCSSSGRQLYRWIEDAAGLWDAPPAENVAEWVGKRSLGLFILRALRDANLEACLKAERERADIQAARDAELDQARAADLAESLEPVSLDSLAERASTPTHNPQ